MASAISTNFTLRAVDVSGTAHWKLFGTGTELHPFDDEIEVMDHAISGAGDLEVKIQRSNLTDIDPNLANIGGSGLAFRDFIGDKLTIDLDSLSHLNGQYIGTDINIDFAGGKDIDLVSIFVLAPGGSRICWGLSATIR